MSSILQVKIKAQYEHEYTHLDPELWYDVKEVVLDKVVLSNNVLYLRRKFDERSAEQPPVDKIPSTVVRHMIIERPKQVEITANGNSYVIKIDDLELQVYGNGGDVTIEMDK
jgi:hypothetical protein